MAFRLPRFVDRLRATGREVTTSLCYDGHQWPQRTSGGQKKKARKERKSLEQRLGRFFKQPLQ